MNALERSTAGMAALAWAAPTTRNFGIWFATGWLTRAPTSGLRCSSLMKAGCWAVLVTARFPTHGEVTAAPSWNAESRTTAGMIARRRKIGRASCREREESEGEVGPMKKKRERV